jgi:electron transport protein HydN
VNSKLNAFVVADPNKCIGCKVCEVACSVAHTDNAVTTVGTLETPIIPKLYLVKTPEVTMPVQCRHCEDAPCANVCPVAAITQVNNAIIIDENTCMGCKTCMIACPFGAIDLVPIYKDGEPVIQNGLKADCEDGMVEKELVVASKCDLCVSRDNGPACVEACPEKALEIMLPQKDKKKRNVEAALNLLESVKTFVR